MLFRSSNTRKERDSLNKGGHFVNMENLIYVFILPLQRKVENSFFLVKKPKSRKLDIKPK